MDTYGGVAVEVATSTVEPIRPPTEVADESKEQNREADRPPESLWRSAQKGSALRQGSKSA
ncbi:hypothetical protein ACG7TL_006704 [Trametes sanguinea]